MWESPPFFFHLTAATGATSQPAGPQVTNVHVTLGALVSHRLKVREILKPNSMLLGGGAFGRCLSPEGRAPMHGISALNARDPGEIPRPF